MFHDATIVIEKQGTGFVLTPAECQRLADFLEQMSPIWQEAIE